MTTQEIAGTTASLCIASDLALHFWNFGIPTFSSDIMFRDDGLQLTTTLTGALTTAIVSGITSDELESMIDSMPDPYDRLVARASVATSFTSAKTLSQGLVLLILSMIVKDGRTVAMDYAGRQLVPAMLMNSLLAFAIPYTMSK